MQANKKKNCRVFRDTYYCTNQNKATSAIKPSVYHRAIYCTNQPKKRRARWAIVVLRSCWHTSSRRRRVTYDTGSNFSETEKKIGMTCGKGGGGTQIMHGRSRMTIDPRIPAMPGRSTSGFHQPGRHCLHQAQSKNRS